MERMHEQFMKEAIVESSKSLQQGCGPTGCVIVRDGVIVARGHNEEHLEHDPTAHAEIVVMRRLCKKLGTKKLSGYTLYSTLQPCGMCSVASIWAGISTIVYGATREDVGAKLFAEHTLDTDDYIADAEHKDIKVIGGILSDECAALYKE